MQCCRNTYDTFIITSPEKLNTGSLCYCCNFKCSKQSSAFHKLNIENTAGLWLSCQKKS